MNDQDLYPKNAEELMVYLKQLEGALEAINEKLDSLDKRLKPFEKEAKKRARERRLQEKP